MRYSGYKTIKDGGWHFTWMGGVDRIRLKLAAYAHQDLNQPQYNNAEVIADHLNRGLIMWADQEEPLEFVALDDSFPQYLRERPEKFSHLLNLSMHASKPN
jgi:beta-1,4-mannosyl-glycoprotein beta-1,4-N-acetylglucosaminyltransferase